MTIIAAMQETWLTDLDPTVAELPVLGWAHTTGINVVPIVLGHPGPLVVGEALRLHTGQVFDPAVNELFADEDVWRETIENYTDYRPGSALPLYAIPSAVPAVAPTTGTMTLAAARTPAAPVSAPRQAVSAPGQAVSAPGQAVSFTGKTFAKTSFWRVDDRLLTLTPDNPSPVGSGVLKITREAYTELRKDLPEATLESFMSKDDEPELPLGDVVEDDDGDDLI